MITRLSRRHTLALGAAFLLGASLSAHAQTTTLLNVSYDPTRELYQEFNAAFAKHWKAKTGETVSIKQSHGGAAKQARAVIDGLEADVVTLALAYDIDAIHEKAKLIPADWQKRLPHNSSPYTSTIVFLVRKGNPEAGSRTGTTSPSPASRSSRPIPRHRAARAGTTWRPGLTPWRKPGGNDATAKDFVTKIYKNVKVLDSGARGSTTTFVERGIGDVFISWENEAFLAIKELGPDKFEIVVPSPVHSCRAADHRGRQGGRQARHAQGRNGVPRISGTRRRPRRSPPRTIYRPRDPAVAAKYAKQFVDVKLITIDDVFGGWQKAQKTHFAGRRHLRPDLRQMNPGLGTCGTICRFFAEPSITNAEVIG